MMSGFISTGSILKAEPQADGRLMVLARATSEAIDKQGESVDYDGAIEAFASWPGNIREMHDGTKAVGKAIEVMPNDDERAIDVKFFVSAGAKDTQAKVLDGTLSGVSVGGKVLDGGRVTKEVNGQRVTVVQKWRMNELSLVDNPANPDATIAVLKSIDGGEPMATDVLAKAEEFEPEAAAQPAPEPADPAADELGAVALLAQVRDSLIALAGMEVAELGDEGTMAAHEILSLIDRVECLRGMKVTQAAIEAAGEISMSAPTGDLSKGIVSAELNKKAFARIRKMGEALKAMSAEIAELEKEFGEAQEEAAEKPEEEAAEPKEEEPAEEEPKKVAEKSTPTGDVAKSVSEPDILKAFGELVEKANEGLRKEVSALAAEVETFRNQPRSGGPVRTAAVEKTLAGMAPVPESNGNNIAELIQKASANLPPHDAEKMRAAVALEMLKAGLPR